MDFLMIFSDFKAKNLPLAVSRAKFLTQKGGKRAKRPLLRLYVNRP